MSQNPYGGEQFGAFGHDEPQRTSVLAIGSLVCSLVCCIPVLPLIGSGLGVGALIGIGGSNGRVGGKGLAIAGIIIGVLVTAAQVGAVLSGSQFMNLVVKATYGSIHEVMEDIEAGDFDSARGLLEGAAGQLPDERFIEFRDAYRAAYGSYQSIPTTMGDLINAYTQVGPQMNTYQPQGHQNIVPAPGFFDNGYTIVVAQLSQNAQPAGTPGSPDFKMPLLDIRIVMPDGSEVGLIAGQLSGGVTPSPVPAPGQVPAPDAPNPDSPSPDTPDDDGP